MRTARDVRGPRRSFLGVSFAAPEPLSGWVNLAASVFTVVSLVAAVVVAVTGRRGEWYALVPIVYLCVLATAALALAAGQQIVFDRHRRYALAMPTVQEAFRDLSEATYAAVAGEPDERAFRRALRDAVTALAAAFTQITGTRCRVSIKLVDIVPGARGKTHLGPHDFAVTTLCRSDTDRRDVARDEPDLVARNTDFKVIFQGERYYFGNDLVAAARRFEYENSHWDPVAIARDRVEYRAAIVWPVTPVDLDEAREPGGPHPPVLGFVCLDSAYPNVFSERFDVPLGLSFTHAVNLALWTFDRARRGTAERRAARGGTSVTPRRIEPARSPGRSPRKPSATGRVARGRRTPPP